MYKNITIEEMLGVKSLNWSLLHTFARKPNLAAAVRFLNLAIMFPKLKPQPDCSPGGHPYDIDIFDRSSRDLPGHLRCTWRRETDRDPTLESDSYGIATYAAVVLPRFINVIKGEAPFFRLPSLTKVRASDVILGEVDLSRFGTRFSSVTDIYIKDSLITKGMLQWLELRRELMSFRIDFQGARSNIQAAPEPGLFDCLAKLHKKPLERLWLGLRHNGYRPAYDKGIIRSPLSEFTALKILRIHVRNLMDFNHQSPTGHEEPLNKLGDVPPALIEVLCIISWGTNLSHWLPDHVESMMSKGQTPALKTLVVDSEIPQSSEYKQACMKEYPRLAAVREKVGIQLVLLDSSFIDSVWPQPGPIGA
ncbi:hypothetical protein BDV19DRAFT_392500 [Aspergillus venezuelensis]